MPRYGDAAIPMQQNFDEALRDVRFLFPAENNMERVTDRKALVPFDDMVCAFLGEVSKFLLKDGDAKAYPDVVTFAFFCRNAGLEQMRKSYAGRLGGRLGRGVTFHIAPSNVPINFAYSLAAGLLAGNRCVVRASSKDFPQTRIVCRAFNAVADSGRFREMKDIFSVVMYGHDAAVTEAFSRLADVRVIWGGDNTIAEIRKAPLKPRAFDITFADRYSLAVFDAGYVAGLEAPALRKAAQDFYNDTYLYDQNACSSPRLIIWLGNPDTVTAAKEKFWEAVHENIAGKYELAPILAVDKLTARCRCAVELEGAGAEPSSDNLITRVRLSKLPEDVAAYSCAGGFYLEYAAETLDDSGLAGIVTEKFQTLSYLGLDANRLRSFVLENGLSGIDRIVPVGRTADFGLVWDGYDLVMTMSRTISSL